MIRIVETTPDRATALTNVVYVGPYDELGRTGFVEAGGYVFTVDVHTNVGAGAIGLGNLHRKMLRVAVRDNLELASFSPPPSLPDAAVIRCDVFNFSDMQQRPLELDMENLSLHLTELFEGQVIGLCQQVAFEYHGKNYRMIVTNIDDGAPRGFVRANTAVIVTTR